MRNNTVENSYQEASKYLNIIVNKLINVDCKIEEKVLVIDDLGLWKTEIQYIF